MIPLRESSSLASVDATIPQAVHYLCSLGLGLAASTGGSLWGQYNNLNNARRQANAENGVLSTATA
jgi:hypothetical protein